MVVTDRLSKQRHFIGCGSMEAKYTARMFLYHVWKHHGLPKTIVSDRGTQFVSRLWQRLCQRLGISTKLSTAYHPETDGQSRTPIKSSSNTSVLTSTMLKTSGWIGCRLRSLQLITTSRRHPAAMDPISGQTRLRSGAPRVQFGPLGPAPRGPSGSPRPCYVIYTWF
jgi:hypothetical protein